MTEQIGNRPEFRSPAPEVLRQSRVLVIDPYSENIKDQGPNAGEFRLSFYSAFVLHTAREMIEAGLVDEVIVFDDASFGDEYESTGDLSYDYLTRDRFVGDKNKGPIIDRSKVTLVKGGKYARTPTQVEYVSDLILRRKLSEEDIFYLGFDYHRQRVEVHAKAFGFQPRFVDVVETHKYFDPKFNSDKLMAFLPTDEIEAMEKPRRELAKKEGKGNIPRFVQALPIVGGPRMLDNRREKKPDGTTFLVFDYRKPQSRIKEVRRMGIEPVKKRR